MSKIKLIHGDCLQESSKLKAKNIDVLLKPFWSYYGGKWRAAPKYPPPKYKTIIEPFAGAAGYSVRYYKHKVILIERNPRIAALWRYLIGATYKDIISLPLIPLNGTKTVDDFKLNQPQKDLIGFWLNAASANPCKKPSSWMRSGTRLGAFWGKKVRKRIAQQVKYIKHWKIIEGNYSKIQNKKATWFIDPPYQNAGKHYIFSSKQIKFNRLAKWCKTRKGQTIVCENIGARWLRFKPFYDIKATPGKNRKKYSKEVIWTNNMTKIRTNVVRNTTKGKNCSKNVKETKTKVKLYNDDCLKMLFKLKAKSIDVVVTSPPYNINMKYNEYKDNKSEQEYLKMMVLLGRELKRVLKKNGSVFLNVGGSVSKPWLPHAIVNLWRSNFVLQNTIIWVKSIHVKGTTHGHFKPSNSEKYLPNTFEYIFHFTKKGTVKLNKLAIGVPFSDKSNIKRFGHKKDVRSDGNVWHIPYITKNNRRTSSSGDERKILHPAEFPVALAERCIKLSQTKSNKTLTVLDPFAGAGNTLVAALGLGHHAKGIEIDKKYIKIAKRRLKDEKTPR